MKKNLLILLFFAFVMQAKASILVEPFVGYALNGTVESGSTEEDYTGTSIGARLGWQQLGLFLALDYRMNNLETDDNDVSETLYGFTVGYDFPILVRVYGEYILGGNAENDYGSGTNDLKNPSGTVLGVGFTGLPFVSLNLEMANYTYDKIDSTKVDTDFKHILLSVSLPLNL